MVRKSQDIGFEGFTWPERFLVIMTTFDFEPLGFAFSRYTMDPVEWAATFKVPGEDGRGVWRCVFPTRPEEAEHELLDFARAADRLDAFVPSSRGAEVSHTNLYAVHQRVATTYRRGRVLLADDAAHVNNPLGGMGLNFGLHDAHGLAQRLAKIWQGAAPDALLDQYDRQRRAVAEQYLQGQTIANKQLLEEREAPGDPRANGEAPAAHAARRAAAGDRTWRRSTTMPRPAPRTAEAAPMVTKLDRPVRRELRIGDRPYVVTLMPDRLRVAIKGQRKGHEVFWEDLIGLEGDTPAATRRAALPLREFRTGMPR